MAYKKENKTLPVNSIPKDQYDNLLKIKDKLGCKSINQVVRIAILELQIKMNKMIED